MDNNNPHPIPQQPVTQPDTSEKNSSKLIVILIGGLFIIALLVGGGYYYLSGMQSEQLKSNQAGSNNPLPVYKPAPQNEDLDKELNDINIATDDSDFTSIDQDLKDL